MLPSIKRQLNYSHFGNKEKLKELCTKMPNATILMIHYESNERHTKRADEVCNNNKKRETS